MARAPYSNDVLYQVTTATDSRLLPLASARVNVTLLDGNPASLYADSTTSISTSFVTTDSNGVFRFWAEPGLYVGTVTHAFLNLPRTIDIFVVSPVETAVSESSGPSINLRSGRWSVSASTPDCAAVIQDAIDTLYRSYGHGEIELSERYRTGPIVTPDTISLRGLSRSETGLTRVGTACGPLILSKATQGRAVERIFQRIQCMTIDGENLGAIKGSGVTTIGSNVITGVSAVMIAQLAEGYVIEGIGVPEGTYITGLGSSTIQMSEVATHANTPRNNILARRAVRVLATGSTTSKVLSVPSTAGIDVGMRIIGKHGGGSDTTYGWGRVLEVDPVNNTVTLDRESDANGSKQTIFVVANENILLEEGAFAPGYVEGRNYGALYMDQVLVTNAGYSGIIVRGQRNQLQVNHSKIANNQGHGLYITGSSDSYLERVGLGTNWMECLVFNSLATPRWTGEAWQTYMTDKHADVLVRGAREFHALNADINGRMKLVGNSSASETNQIYTVTGINFKWFATNNTPGTLDNAFLEVQDAHVEVIGGGFVPDTTTNDRPQYLGRILPGGTGSLRISNVHMNEDPADPKCPFSVAVSPVGHAVVLDRPLNQRTGQVSGPEHSVRSIDVLPGGSLTLSSWEREVFVDSSSQTVAALSVTLPPDPRHRQTFSLAFGVNVSTLTWISADGRPIKGLPLSASIGQTTRVSFYRTGNFWHLSAE